MHSDKYGGYLNMGNQDNLQSLSLEERKLLVDERRLFLDSSFARKWLPTLATVVAGLIAAIFGYVEKQHSVEQTIRLNNDAKARGQNEWGVKVVEMYFNKRELFDLGKNPEQATANLRVLSAVAPDAVKGLLAAELERLSAPTGEVADSQRFETLAKVAQIQTDIGSAKGESPPSPASFEPKDFMVYVQYVEGAKEIALRAQTALSQMGFKTPGVEQVRKGPSKLQVRYYRLEQRMFAEKLAKDIGLALGFPVTSDNVVQIATAKKLPPGILELWLP
jgi:hypothetical protein